MYGFWYLVIASGVLLGISIFLLVFGWRAGSDVGLIGIGGIFVFIIPFIICLVLAISNPMQAKRKYRTFCYQREMIEEIIESGEDLDNVSISQTIIEANEWLAKAKASKEMYGCFSSYYKIDIENIKPIQRPQKQESKKDVCAKS